MTDIELDDIEIDDETIGKAVFDIDAEYDPGASDADGRQASAAGWCVDATLTAIVTDEATLTGAQIRARMDPEQILRLEQRAADTWLELGGW